jgi:hypothetical protein
MSEMSHSEFSTLLGNIADRGILMFKHGGEQHVGVVDEVYFGSNGKTVITVPDMYVEEHGRFVELTNNGPRHVVFNWLAATFEWIGESDPESGRFRVHTEDGPIDIILDSKGAKFLRACLR